MSGVEQLQYLSWILYLAVFAAVLVRTIQHPTPAHVDMTLFFGATTVVILATTLTQKLRIGIPAGLAEDTTGAAAVALGYLLLRLVNDFSQVPRLLLRAVEVGMVLLIAVIGIGPKPLSVGVALVLVAYLVLVIAYNSRAFALQAARSHGVTRRRMEAAAVGSLCLDLVLIIAGVRLAVPAMAPALDELSAALGLLSGVCYFVGFAPPTWLRRAWQEPEVRAFMARSAQLAHLPDIRTVIDELERGAADAVGAPAARIGLWHAEERQLRIYSDGKPVPLPSVPRAFRDQRATLVTNFRAANTANPSLAELYNARAVLGAPMNAYGKRLGVLLVYAPRSPVFANSDLELVQLLADQAAIVLESRALLEEAAQVRAREEATRLKEDFLSSAAHDLKTPLTGIVTQSQVLRRRAQRDPTAPVDRVGLDRLIEQSQRLTNLVLELLDVSRLEHGSLIGTRERVDLAALVRGLIEHDRIRWKRVKLRADAEVLATVDPPRFEQVVTNLVENALKYSPPPASVTVTVWSEDGEARLSVHDLGIGIPSQDQALVFERFHRARNVDDRRFAGMGLGLYITRGIVEQHGGRIWLESTPGVGSTFFVAMPLADGQPVTADSASAEVTRG